MNTVIYRVLTSFVLSLPTRRRRPCAHFGSSIVLNASNTTEFEHGRTFFLTTSRQLKVVVSDSASVKKTRRETTKRKVSHLPFSTPLILTAVKLFIKCYERERSIKLRPLRIHNGGCFETLNLLHVSSCQMFTFCDVLHETKQKTYTNSRECAVWTGRLITPCFQNQRKVSKQPILFLEVGSRGHTKPKRFCEYRLSYTGIPYRKLFKGDNSDLALP